jgi:hypothetical protein
MKIKEMHTKPILYEPPKTNGVAAIDKEMVCRLEHHIAKRAVPTIFPTTLLQAFDSPKPILKQKARKNLCLGRAQTFHAEELRGEPMAPKNCALYADLEE